MGGVSDAPRVIVGEVFGLAISEPGALLGVALDVYRVSVFDRDVWGWRLDEAVLEARFGGVSVDVGVGGDCRLEVYGFVPVGEAGEEYSVVGENAGAGLLGALGMGRRCGGSFPTALDGARAMLWSRLRGVSRRAKSGARRSMFSTAGWAKRYSVFWGSVSREDKDTCF
jgi:hypothetical protein